MSIPPVLVSITGTLSMPRKDAVALLESKTNARFSPSVTYETNYLVAARLDTRKARKAAEIGVTVISEADMMRFIEAGAFPPTAAIGRPKYPHHSIEFKVTEEIHPSQIIYLEYEDAGGVHSERYFLFTCKAEGSGHEYFGGYDVDGFKTFRVDRVLKWEVVAVEKEP